MKRYVSLGPLISDIKANNGGRNDTGERGVGGMGGGGGGGAVEGEGRGEGVGGE